MTPDQNDKTIGDDIFDSDDKPETNISLLYLSIFHLATEFCEFMIKEVDELSEDDIIQKDLDAAFSYAFSLFYIHDRNHGQQLGHKNFIDALSTYQSYLDEELFYTEEMLKNFVLTLWENLGVVDKAFSTMIKNSNPDGLMSYAKEVLSIFPFAEGMGAFSLAGIAVTTALPNQINYISKVYPDLVKENNTSEHSCQEKQPAYSNTTEQNKAVTYNETQKQKSPNKNHFILCVLLLVVSITGNIYLYNKNTQISTKLTNVRNELDRCQDNYFNEIMNHRDTESELSWYRYHAAIVTTTGSKYHTSDCYHLDGASYWIYNIEAAKQKGYTPCLDCH